MTNPPDWDADPEFDDGPSDESFELSDAADVVDDQYLQFALTGDGSALQLTGPGAGSVVELTPSREEQVRARLPTRDHALDGPSPLLLVHRPFRSGDVVPRLMTSILAAASDRVSLGAVTPLPRSTAESSTSWLSGCTAAAVRIADPSGFKLDGGVISCTPPSPRCLSWWPYLGDDPLVTADVLDAQRQVGANLLLSPGRAVDPSDPQNSLDHVFGEADEALAHLQPGDRMALNLTLPRSWLTSTVLRDQLLAQLLDQEQFDIWYVRVQWPSSLRSTEQPVDLALLQGYKRLSQLAADEERTLLLPQTGTTGWLQLAFGAAGFGSGLPGSDQAFKEPAGGGGGAAPIERYFEPALLHSVERTVHEALRARPNYVACDCPYCPLLHASPDWRHDMASLHQLHWMGRLSADTAGVARGGANGAVRRAVRAAVATAAEEPLAGLSAPRHLAAWDQLL